MRSPVALMLALALTGCSEERDGESTEDRLVGGVEAPGERPEIGRLDSCTATLVHRRVVLTAAHCIDFRSGPGSFGTFVIERDGREHSFDTTAAESLGHETGARDLALVLLARPVDGVLARPVSLARSAPRVRDRVTAWGYGCTARSSAPTPQAGGAVVVSGEATTKQRIDYDYGAVTTAACPGDSGGPHVDLVGAIFGVTSAYVRLPDDPSAGPDVVADVVRSRADVESAISRLTR